MTEDFREPLGLLPVEEDGREARLRSGDPAQPAETSAPRVATVELLPSPGPELPDTEKDRSDTELVEDFLSGNRAAFELLVLRHQDRVFRICVRLLDSRALAEEAAQEVFVKIFRNLDRFRGDSLFTTWMTRIALNHCRNVASYRIRRKERSHFSLDEPRENDDGGTMKRELPSGGEGADELLVRAERLRLVESQLRELDPLWQEILVLRDVEGMAYEQISETLELSPGTVKSRLHRARNELKKRVHRHLGPQHMTRGIGDGRS